MTKTYALLLDSYRELNAKRLFWVVLALSGLVVAVFASLGLRGASLTLLGWTTPVHSVALAFVTKSVFYKQLFVTYGIDIWLSWIATVLALVSTAGIFPDFMAGGSIDLYLSKPISRLRLFLTKLLGGMLFVTFQVTVFCICCFFVLGIRGGTWEPGVFIAIPLVVLMFSYLFAACVLLGVLTRSTIAALLLTLLFWAVLWGVQRSEALLQLGQIMDQQRAARLDRQIQSTQAQLDQVETQPATTAPAVAATSQSTDDSSLGSLLSAWADRASHSHRQLEFTLSSLRAQRQSMPVERFATAHAILAGISVPLPKTSGTIEVLERQLIKLTDLPPVASTEASDAEMVGGPDAPPGRDDGGDNRSRRSRRAQNEYERRQLDIALRKRPAIWILGTSCAFEAAVLGMAAWLFCRRDF